MNYFDAEIKTPDIEHYLTHDHPYWDKTVYTFSIEILRKNIERWNKEYRDERWANDAEEKIKKIKKKLQKGEKIAPIIIHQMSDGSYQVNDGTYQASAVLELGATEFMAYVFGPRF